MVKNFNLNAIDCSVKQFSTWLGLNDSIPLPCHYSVASIPWSWHPYPDRDICWRTWCSWTSCWPASSAVAVGGAILPYASRGARALSCRTPTADMSLGFTTSNDLKPFSTAAGTVVVAGVGPSSLASSWSRMELWCCCVRNDGARSDGGVYME